MARIHEVRRLPWSARQMFDLVADVGRYAEFLPWVVATRVRSDSETEMVADMLVGFSALREKFTSRVEKRAPDGADGAGTIQVHYVDGPLRDLDNRWVFRPVGPDACEIDFCVEFAFRNALFQKLANQYLDKAFRKMVGAFEQRAAQVYGSSSSSAQSVA
ncbi:type II toxin-antitoxin system RatA family toxin [Novosphingobium aerophilum]|uniref:Type II toxin-antitoxin system RatA family toxin n=1 Tax=Novosphingobium aerophilum TaxID=2839843 RepID=A0A7X1F5I8_9SPHN|nr:type II toxin-antitoxin system RatA family toxin [Novosphingobium aerophilum]MBC2650770.1 type II toxin-antitoxin system RatA family toxin [Novosphingobium aerophilum]